MKIHRISLSAESYARLAYISALEQISPKDWIEERIKDAWSLRDGKANNPIIQLELWQLVPRPSYGKIALDVDYPKKTVEFRVKKLIEAGELVD